MENQVQWSDVKNIKFHHRVKRFYYKNLFRKIYTVAIVWLIAANIVSMVKYSSFAGNVYTIWTKYNNAWWWWSDSASNWYDSWNDRTERQWPCPSWWHVPSRWERQDIVTARCHYRSDCSDSDLTNVDDYWNLNFIEENWLWESFLSDFGMTSSWNQWSSSPYYDDEHAWTLRVLSSINPSNYYTRQGGIHVRCLKNSTDVENWDPSLDTTSEGYVLTDNGKSYTLALSALEGTYYRWANENTDNSTWVDPSQWNWYWYWYGSAPSPCYYYDIDWNQQELSDGSNKDLFTSNWVSGDTCYTHRYNFTCDNWKFKFDDWNEYHSNLYDYCEEEWRNTAELITNGDWSKTIIYDGKSYRVASWDLDGTYYRWFNDNTDHSKWVDPNWVWTYTGITLYGNTNWLKDAWWWSGDTVENWYDSWNDRSERQWPCPSGWHVPSRWERQNIVTARCHYTGGCFDSDLTEKDSYWNLNTLNNLELWTAFKSDFEMNFSYWSSSPKPGNDNDAWILVFAQLYNPYSSIKKYDVDLNIGYSRNNNIYVRCLKDSIDNTDSSTSSLTTTSEGYVLTDNGKSYTLALNDLDGTYYRWFNDNTDHSKWLSTAWTSPYTGIILYGNTNQLNNAWWWSGDTVDNWYDSWNPRSERQWPCEDWWHVPSRWERNAVVTAWCHLSSNDCISSDLQHADDWTADNGLINIENHYKHYLWNSFNSDLGMSYSSTYWSSSPNPDSNYAWRLIVIVDGRILPNRSSNRKDTLAVRCIKDSIDDEPIPSIYTVTFTTSPEWYWSVDKTTVTVDEGTTVEINNNTVTLWTKVVTATPTADTQQYDYSFVNWTSNCGDTVSANCSIVANFSRVDVTPTQPSWWSSGGGSSSWWWSSSGWWKRWSTTIEDTTDKVEDKTHGAVDNTGAVVTDENKAEEQNVDQPVQNENQAAATETHNSASTQNNSSSAPKYTEEFYDAYNFAKSNWITTKETIQDAKMYTELTRIQMAKMMSQYAMNVLGQTPDISKWTIKFYDVPEKLNKEYDNAVTLAYQLGIMWLNMKNNNFRPRDPVTRAEFATALSRMLYHTEDGTWKVKYYEPHIATLYNKWIINNTNPKLVEKRWYVMLMLMRSVK